MKKLGIFISSLLLIILVSCNDVNNTNNSEIAQKIIDSLNISVNNTTVDEDFSVPASISYERKSYDLTYSSENTNALTFSLNGSNYDAKIVRSDNDVKVNFSASVTYNDASASKNFNVTIAKKEANQNNDEEIALNIINSINVSVNGTKVSADFKVPASVTYGGASYDITWTAKDSNLLGFNKSNNEYNVVITRGDNDVSTTFTASISYNGIIKTNDFNITIAKKDGAITPSGELPSDITYTGYYSDMTGNFDTYDEFFNTLNDILVSTHTSKGSYSKAWTILEESDAYDSDHIECFYTGSIIEKDRRDQGSGSDNTIWNREHVWAKSHGFDDQSYWAYSDCHHLRATGKAINSSRGNKYFDEVNNPTDSDQYGNKWTSSVFEPRDEVKGDVARILFYMVTRYHDSTLTLTLDNSGSYPNSKGVGNLGMLDTLVKWHYEDPVSETEIKRNEVVYSYQGDRNPYIDHPEFVYFLYQDESEELGITEENVLTKVENGNIGGGDIEDTTIADLINDIEELRNKTITLEDKTLLDSLQSRYDLLSAADKSKVTNYNLLQQKYREYNELLGISDIVYNLMKFPSTGNTFGKEAEITDQGVTFYTTNYSTKDSEFLLGFNNEKIYNAPNDKYNIAGWEMFAILEFNVENLNKISFEVGTINKNFDGCSIIYSSDGQNYELIADVSSQCKEGNIFEYSFDSTKSGYFAIVVYGSAPRMIMKNFTLSYIS